jgi:hypothetical protein
LKSLKNILFIISLCVLLSEKNTAQIIERKVWCITTCNSAGDEKENTKDLYGSRGIVATLRGGIKKFPLQIVVINTPKSKKVSENEIRNTIKKLNTGFAQTSIEFSVDAIKEVSENITIEVLSENNYAEYKRVSSKYDKQDQITVFIFDYDPNLCAVSPTSISCGRTGGFSYILSKQTNNVVLSRFDLEDDKVLVHEMGHFFGLYHTFEEDQFGKDNFVEDCKVAGDCLCDTPPDPGSGYEVYINPSKCEMIGLKHDNGHEYKPLINNFMAYYKPCYLQPYSFTKDQIDILKLAANSAYRSQFARL